MIERFFVSEAPAPPKGVKYAHATSAGGWLYVSGQLPSEPGSPLSSLPAGIEAQAEQAFHNLVTIVEAAAFSLSDTVFVRIYLRDFERDFEGFNSVYHRFFSDRDHVPSRTTVGVAKLGRGALVEIDLTLYRDRE